VLLQDIPRLPTSRVRTQRRERCGPAERGDNEGMNSTHITRHIKAPRAKVYGALIDADAIARWKVPTGMTSYVHAFEGREGGTFRISLTYDAQRGRGKTSAHTDTYRGRFIQLVPNERVVEVDEFETTDPGMRGEMTITITLSDADGGGTDLVAVHDGVPPGVSAADNEAGWQSALARLAARSRPASKRPRTDPLASSRTTRRTRTGFVVGTSPFHLR
jgi:uncharacterized protein YndB with AHSA1/START domain